ncbi:uncharacterized protein LOC133524807 [Cydia pomonella]|uniref:uncharacterized protein LOC133524807 n=1 Tax=Cydia pomonella TaxID=82600 RepID=UPI002ADDA984|nr:uncharacterized protein LOC133524807 [Cydia pomonella]
MQLIAVHGRPLALVSDVPFRKFMKLAATAPRVTKPIDLNAQSQIKVINEKSVRALIPETAYQIKLKIASEIREKLISLKVDSATCSERKFFGVNIQYLNNDKIIVRNLAIAEIFQNQTAEFLKEKLLEILSEFYISTDQIYSLTTDNGSNMKKMVKLLKGNYCSEDLFEDTTDNSDPDMSSDEEDDQLNEVSEETANFESTLLQNAVSNDTHKVRGMLCAAHTLQLAIKDAINESVEVQVTLDLARKIAKILLIPTNRNLLKIAHLKVPIIDCATRWTSKYDMLVRLQSLKEFCENIHEVSRLASGQFWEEIEQFITCLKPLYDCTLILQREQLTVAHRRIFLNFWPKVQCTKSTIIVT